MRHNVTLKMNPYVNQILKLWDTLTLAYSEVANDLQENKSAAIHSRTTNKNSVSTNKINVKNQQASEKSFKNLMIRNNIIAKNSKSKYDHSHP